MRLSKGFVMVIQGMLLGGPWRRWLEMGVFLVVVGCGVKGDPKPYVETDVSGAGEGSVSNRTGSLETAETESRAVNK